MTVFMYFVSLYFDIFSFYSTQLFINFLSLFTLSASLTFSFLHDFDSFFQSSLLCKFFAKIFSFSFLRLYIQYIKWYN